MVRVAGYAPLEAAAGLFTINVSMLCTFWAWGLLNPRFARSGIDLIIDDSDLDDAALLASGA